MALTMLLPLSAQIMGNNIVVTITPDHKDWNYKAGETANFEINVLKSGTLLDNAKVDIEAGPVMYPDAKKSVTLKEGSIKWSGKMTTPGFYRITATAHVGGKDYRGLCTAAFSPEKLQPYCKEPKDFDEFWSKALNEARKNDLNPTRRLLPERCTKDENVYEVSYINDNANSRMYGILSVPVKPGKYPALLRVPGAGVRPYSGDTYTAPGKCIVLEIGIHGIPVTMQQSIYDDLRNAALNNYWDVNLAEPNKNYYKRVVTGAVRGVDFIASLPEWDGKAIGVTGSSQGGFLSLATAALDKRITFLGVVHDAMCDFEAEMHNVGGGWPHYFYWDVKNGTNKELLNMKVEGARYYDGVNFARRVTQPGWYSFGYNDEVVPPTSSYSTYNIIKAPKTLSVYQMTGHYWYQEQWDEWQNFIRKQMGIE
ncbi:cephalosporin deacetylase [Prevotella lacticifex]|uniref:Cephalosporin deacetylase n=2 Tax=Prevotella lacticifex TaxID=2854755 RepID=A0A9R1CXE3_9BACT|nr:cephalosporin deacetylase [Prevotella lacticifex]GJG42488.1 cephalosporin deacetylase [Prevotella lacticifex]GJG48839.1 cephalosporin deacetylase [Prevotella lacticifex]GJG51350.1 cephalosporin deacetylase [Prevotella lacticifex]GJG54747.1 cephalosporin deacetylase [Prevotella lacticifex]